MKLVFILQTIKKNIVKHKKGTTISILVSIALIFFLNIYIGNLYQTQNHLMELSETMPIYGYISNLNGTQKVGLEIKEDLVEQIQNSSYTKNVDYTVRILGGIGEFETEQWRKALDLSILACNNLENVVDISVDDMEGLNAVLNSSKKECIVDRAIMKQKGWSVGQTIPLNLYYYVFENHGEMKNYPLQICDFKIAGVMDSVTTQDKDRVKPDILVPMNTVKDIYHESQIPCNVDFLSFYVKDPLKLNETKKEMESFGLMPVIPNADPSMKGNALVLKDVNFISTANYLREEIDTLYRLLPIIIVCIAVVGYIIGFLLIQERKNEFLIMRLLGASNGKTICLLYAENICLSLLSVLGVFSISTLSRYNGKVILSSFVLVFVSYSVGNLISLFRLGCVNVLKLNSQLE